MIATVIPKEAAAFRLEIGFTVRCIQPNAGIKFCKTQHNILSGPSDQQIRWRRIMDKVGRMVDKVDKEWVR